MSFYNCIKIIRVLRTSNCSSFMKHIKLIKYPILYSKNLVHLYLLPFYLLSSNLVHSSRKKLQVYSKVQRFFKLCLDKNLHHVIPKMKVLWYFFTLCVKQGFCLLHAAEITLWSMTEKFVQVPEKASQPLVCLVWGFSLQSYDSSLINWSI